jgi:putative ABC transport system permease protein
MDWLSPFDIGLNMGLTFGWLVLSLTLAFRLLKFPDLTIEGSFPLGAAVYAVAISNGMSIGAGMILAVLTAAVPGAFTAFLHVNFRVNKFLAGIITASMCYSIILRVMSGPNIGIIDKPTLFNIPIIEKLNGFNGGSLHGGSIGFMIIAIAAGGWLIYRLLYSRYGIQIRAAGSNPVFASSVGINSNISLIAGLAVTNALAGLSGAFLVMHQGFADVGMGQGLLIMGIASMAIGERLLPVKKLSYPLFVIISAIAGSIIYQILLACAVRIGISPSDLKLLTAVLVLIVIILSRSGNGDDLMSEK